MKLPSVLLLPETVASTPGPLPPAETANSAPFVLTLLQAVQELGFFGTLKAGTAILTLYLGYRLIALGIELLQLYATLWIQQ
jgi:hypothetical protein